MKEALEDLHRAKGAKAILAGGTDLMIDLRRLKEPPIRLLDISQIAQLSEINQENSEIVLGPLVTMSQLESSPLISDNIPALAAATASVGSPQIRNRATIGGNLCNASPCADTVPALVALNAVLLIQSHRKSRELPIEDFFLGPYRVALEANELLVGIRVPIPSAGMKMTFYKLGRRKALAIARLNLVVGLSVHDNKISDAVMSPGSIMPSPRRLRTLEHKLIGQAPIDDLFQSVGNEVSELMVMEAGERWSTPYKKPVVAKIVSRCLHQCLGKQL